VTEQPARAAATRWESARVVGLSWPGPTAVILRLELAGRTEHRPGQHYVLRLTAADGYQALRSYSVASPPQDPALEFYIGRLEDGEVSGYLADAVEVGDLLEVRGPIGGWFAWDGETPAVGIGGGTGAVPLVAMLRHARARGRPDLFSLVVSARTADELPYGSELAASGARVILTRATGPDGRPAGRIGEHDLAPLVRTGATWYVCGSSGFVETVGRLLVDLGVTPTDIRVERFGPSGT
jgi:ferredoxin-NADP reductase